MNKIKIGLGVIVLMLTAIVSMFFTNIVSVQADNSQPASYSESLATKTDEAGTYEGTGFYPIGETATLRATMNPGYRFVGWIEVDSDGNPLEQPQLSADLEYSFVVERDIYIGVKWERIEYSVLLAQGLDADFDIIITNNSGNEKFYYGDSLTITISNKNAHYIHDISKSNIFVNNVNLKDLGYITNINNGTSGFKQFDFTVNVQEDLLINIEYDYMYKLTLQSVNDGVEIQDLMQRKLITIQNAYSRLEVDQYLVWEKQTITINTYAGDRVYKFEYSQFNTQTSSILVSQTFALTEDSVLKVSYKKVIYQVEFEFYLKNSYGSYDLMQQPIYEIANSNLTAGEQLEVSYQDGQIIAGQQAYDKLGVYGYRFVGLSLGDLQDYQSSLIFVMDAEIPRDSKIKVLFELMQYNLSIKFVDNFFADGVDCSLSTSKPTIQSMVTARATSSSYEILGWKQSASADDYLSSNTEYTFEFDPVSDDNSVEYFIYLDVDYKYITTTYTLNANSITKNMDYDTVSITGSETGGTIVFNSSENDKPEITVNYTQADVSVDGSTTTINTNNVLFGNLVIENAWSDGSKVIYNGLAEYSISTAKEGDAYVYAFQKYTYYANLKVAKIDSIGVIESEGSAEVTFNGVLYDGQTPKAYTQVITSSITYNSQLESYRINYEYPLYLFKENGETGNYTKVTLMNAEYIWDGENFVQLVAEFKPLSDVGVELTKSKKYELTLSNLLPNNAILFISNPISTTSYGFASNSKDGTILTTVNLNDGSIASLLNGEPDLNVVVEYIKLEGNVTLAINNLNAYLGENVQITADGVVKYGLIVTAVGGVSVEVKIDQSKIGRGYSLDGFRLNGVSISTTDTLSFTMGEAYVNQTIYIEFSTIEYVVNMNYLDVYGNKVTNMANLHVKLVDNANTFLTKTSVSIGNEYRFKAILDEGYYVSSAYIGTDAYTLTSLEQSNSDKRLETIWILNQDNFEQAIINNANSGMQVELYIKFVLHKYNVSVYFEIDANITELTKPNILLNEKTSSFKSVIEEVDNGGGTIKTNRYKANLENINHGETVRVKIFNIVEGIYLSSWRTGDGKTTNYTGLSIQIDNIADNIVLIAEFGYIEYDINFVYLDMDKQVITSGVYGTAISSVASYVKFQNIEYSVTVNKGYVLKEEYYVSDKNEQIKIEKPLKFDPANIKVEYGIFNIYLQFDLKKVDLTIKNIETAGMINKFTEPLASWEVTRIRGEEQLILTETSGYQFLTGDILEMKISTISIGIVLRKIQLGGITIDLDAEAVNYSLKTQTDGDGNVVSSIYYELKVTFDADIISGLEDTEELNNVLDNRKYNMVYTYNFIEKKFGIQLAVSNLDTGETSLLGKDKEFNSEVGFGTYMQFRCAQDTLENVISKKFRVLGFIVAGEEIRTKDLLYELNSLELWEKIALNRYNKGSSKIEITLKLSPKITLKNCKENVYTTIYTGREQGLVVGQDVMVEGDFTIVIKYSTDNLIYTESKPINSNIYDVKISATIAISANEIIEVVLDEKVSYVINKRQLTIGTVFNTNNPLAKDYDGTNSVKTIDLFNGLKLEGVIETDKNLVRIDSNELRGSYSSSQANTTGRLYDVTVVNIYLLDNNNNPPQNYELQLGDSGVVFESIGKINPKKLYISGFSASNKVFDGTDYIAVDTHNIQYSGKLEIDSTKIITDNLKFYLKEYSVGYKREILLDYSEALAGADSTNYTVSYKKVYVDVYPYERQCRIEGFGTFKIVDKDKLCLIPIEADFYGTAYVNGHIEYRDIYPFVESFMTRAEDFDVYYEFRMKTGVINSAVPEGLYLYIPNSDKVSKVLQLVDEKDLEKLSVETDEEYNIIKIGEGQSKFAVILKTTYIPLWVIILIIVVSASFILLCVLAFIIIRKKKEQKYSVNDKI